MARSCMHNNVVRAAVTVAVVATAAGVDPSPETVEGQRHTRPSGTDVTLTTPSLSVSVCAICCSDCMHAFRSLHVWCQCTCGCDCRTSASMNIPYLEILVL